MIIRKLPVNLINHIMLHRILKNVSFNLPDSYDLVAGTRVENILYIMTLLKLQR